jgi:hypothetical protein
VVAASDYDEAAGCVDAAEAALAACEAVAVVGGLRGPAIAPAADPNVLRGGEHVSRVRVAKHRAARATASAASVGAGGT